MDIPRTKILFAAATMFFVTIALTVITSGLLSSQQSVPANGVVTHSVGIRLYIDQAATTTCTSIDWGLLFAESSVTRTIYVKNTGNTTEKLHMATSDWNPATVTSMIDLTWDKEDSSLSAGSVVSATLTLTMSQDTGVVDSFDFNIIIEGIA